MKVPETLVSGLEKNEVYVINFSVFCVEVVALNERFSRSRVNKCLKFSHIIYYIYLTVVGSVRYREA